MARIAVGGATHDAEAAGGGAQIRLDLGGKADIPADEPLPGPHGVGGTPGGCLADPRDPPYRNREPGARLGPKGPPFNPGAHR